ncbi:unnamed protein product [Euphydryas editha]|uniref:Large ribosomal subunit protein mL43 n=1 Tax=Euphydryas editha TaxID=104508 RepID=A0AAU9UR87_EUPED|nr:unnamed protein product [Euphydryas editha]
MSQLNYCWVEEGPRPQPRFIAKLRRVQLIFCICHSSSRGIRDYLEQGLVEFSRQNPDVIIYLKPEKHISPVFVAEYTNGDTISMSVHNRTNDEIVEAVEVLNTVQKYISGYRLQKYKYADYTSIIELRSTFKDLEPSEELPAPEYNDNKLSRSDIENIRQMFERQNVRKKKKK